MKARLLLLFTILLCSCFIPGAKADTNCSVGNDSILFDSTFTGYDLSIIDRNHKEGSRFTLVGGPYTITRYVIHSLSNGGGTITASLYSNSLDSQNYTTQIPGTGKTVASGNSSFVLDAPYENLTNGTYWLVLETNSGMYTHNLGNKPGSRVVYTQTANNVCGAMAIYGCGHNFDIIPCRNGETGICRQSVDASQGNVQVTIDSSSDNDGVYIPADSKTWTIPVTLRNKKIKVFGAGIDQTNITIPSGALAFDTFCTPATPFRISGMTFIGNNTYSQGGIRIQAGSGTCKGIEIDRNRFHNIGSASIFIYAASYPGQGDVYGVVHSNIFDGIGGAYGGQGVETYQSTDFETASIGTDNAMFVEGNTFSYDTPGLGPVTTDTASGGRIVFRFNTVKYAWAATHGSHHDTGSNVFYELYNNDFTISDGNNGVDSYVNQGGGEEIHFNNVVTATPTDVGGGFVTKFYRSCCLGGWAEYPGYSYRTGTVSASNSPIITGSGTKWLANVNAGQYFFIDETSPMYMVMSVDSDTQLTLTSTYSGTISNSPYIIASPNCGTCQSPTGNNDAKKGRCDGTNTYDGNYPGLMGYPCWGGIGRSMKSGLYFSPVYHWNNRYKASGKKINMYVGGITCFNSPQISDHAAANRDYYNAVGGIQTSPTNPFDGSTGMGFGTLVNRPTTCKSGGEIISGIQTYPDQGVGYYATDQNILYRCSSPNNWTIQYQPYTCPHPSASGLSGSCDYTMAGVAGYPSLQNCSQLSGTCCSSGQNCTGTTQSASDCSTCCTAGTCQACLHKSDNNPCDGCVDMTELTAFMSRWNINNLDVTMKELIEAIGLWNRGCP